VTNRRPHLILIGLILAALGGVALLGIPGSPMHKKTTLGLDLQGGLEVVLRAKPPKHHTLSSGDLDRAVTIIRNRIDRLGVSEPDVREQPPDQIVIELAGVHDTKRALDIIGKTAQLELYDLETSLTGPSAAGGTTGAPVAETSLYTLLSGEQAAAKKGSPSAYYVFDKKTKRLIFGPSDTRSTLLKDARASLAGNRKPFPKATTVLAVPGGLSPHNSSIRRSAERTSPACNTRSARSARARPAGRGTRRPPSMTSISPRMWNSMAPPGPQRT